MQKITSRDGYVFMANINLPTGYYGFIAKRKHKIAWTGYSQMSTGRVAQYLKSNYDQHFDVRKLKEMTVRIISNHKNRSVLPYECRHLIGLTYKENPYGFLRHRKAWSIRRKGAADIMARNHGYEIIWT